MARRPLPSVHCPFCTDGCTVQQDTTDAFSLRNLLPAGTITVAVHDGQQPCPSACHSHEWCLLPKRKPSAFVGDTLLRPLAFLIQHLFLRATCRLGASGRVLFIRLYLIPNDLPNVCGQLHRRLDTVVNEARRHMRVIVPLIEQTHGLWDADETCLNAPQHYFLPSHIDNRTMAEIYSDLPSPILEPSKNENTRLSRDVASGGAIWGLRTTLYGYQRHSVAVMLAREMSTTPVPDPLYLCVSCMFGIRCYIQPSTMTVLRECPMFSPSRSGLLCEELGTGKTVMIISLVLVTASQLSDPEESTNERPVLTPLAYNHFPSAEYALARDKAGLDQVAVRRVPSLVELLVHYFSSLKVTTGRPAFADELKASHLWPFVRANTPFYHHYHTEREDAANKPRRRNSPNQSSRTMYLSSATLVIVPLALLGQWKAEIDKHCHDYIRYLIVGHSTNLPHARKLASDYELVVMSDFRFRTESKNNRADKLHDLAHCTCPCLVGTRVPDCRCPGDRNVTPLLQIRWKRLVIDEGHTASGMATTINYFVRQLSIQHKWIVTGTPTSNILGLQLGRTTDEQWSSHYADSVEPIANFPRSESPVPMSPSPDDNSHVRIWGDYERLNLRKLGTMIGDFLGVPQFRSDSEAFVNHVSAPLCNRHGPQPGAIDVLMQVMQMVMVRHRIEDIENDVLLPPMRHDIIYMDMDYYAIKSYNAMQASLAINAIDSEREGPDYLFHPSKAKALQVAISNSSQGLFWSSSDIMYNVDENCEYADEYIAKAVKRNVRTEEMDLLRQALAHAATAANDGIWRAMQLYADVPFKVSGLDPVVFEAWTRTGLRDSSRTIDVMHPDRLVDLRSIARKKPLISIEELVEEGNTLDRKEKRMMKKTIGPRKVKHAKQTTESARKGTIEVLKKHIEWMGNSEPENRQDGDKGDKATFDVEAAARTRIFPPLSGARIGPSLSTKLNYILSEVQQYSMKEKFLIFSNSVLTLFQIGEALTLFEIKHLQYTNQEQYLSREQHIMTFETSDVYRVLLVNLKLGARGLNLISASRIIFCEPVWHPDVESQAIKRAHRIGQTRPVTVKTLAIRSTPEEAMIDRRQYLRTSDKIPSMTTESGMRQYLQHPRFLNESTSDSLASPVVLSLDNWHQSTARYKDNADRVDVESDIASYESSGDLPVRKKGRLE